MGQRWAKALFVCYSTDGGEYWVEQYSGRYRCVGPVTTDTIFSAPTLERAVDHVLKVAGPDCDITTDCRE